LTLSIPRFQKNLLDWYKNNARLLPWRKGKNPYYIWISEIMLQQTRVNTVKNYFTPFIERFPTIQDLASAEPTEILCYWQGLGYYRRALNIVKTAKIINRDYQGSFPIHYQEILSLPGIGPYTAGAIASISFNQAVPAIDGNVKRIISRIFFLIEDINHNDAIKKINEKINQLIPEQRPGDFNQALMEIGATICTPRRPDCQKCPVKNDCMAALKMKQDSLPIKSKKKTPKPMIMEIAIVKKDNKLLLVKRTDEGLLADMWGLPAIESPSSFPNGKLIQKQVEKQYGLKVRGKPLFIKKLNHIFTHRIWKIYIFLISTENNQISQLPNIFWSNKEELENFPIPQAFQKCLKEYFHFSLSKGTGYIKI